MLESKKFEEEVIKFCNSEKCTEFGNVYFQSNKKVKIGKAEQNFDLVSENGEYIGDAKYYKMRSGGEIPHGKIDAITAYVWKLEKTSAKYKFLIFGLDKRVSNEWLKRFGNLTNIQFYFFNNNKLEKLN